MTWTVLAKRNTSGSPGSGDWEEFLCAQPTSIGYEITICGYEWNGNGRQGSKLVADPDYARITITAPSEHNIHQAVTSLGWKLADLPSVVENWPR